MKILIQSNDPVLLSFAEALLVNAGLQPVVADAHTSAMVGSLSILPRRMLVPADQEAEARTLLSDAGLGDALAGE